MGRTTAKGTSITGHHAILDGDAHLYQHEISGDIWHFRMWIKDERKHYRKSLKTTNFNVAIGKAKELALELSSNQRVGKQIFGITLDELVELYVEYRSNDISTDDDEFGDFNITHGRWLAIKSMLKHILTMLGGKTKISDIEVDALYEYRHLRNEIKHAGLGAIKNEQAIINAMWKWGYRHKHTPFEVLEFRKMSGEIGKRNTFTDKEYDKLVRFMRSWTSVKQCKDKKKRLERLMVRDYVLISSNSCCRPGELRQLKYSDILGYEHHPTEGEYTKEKDTQLVDLRIRKETAKVRKERIILVRGGEYFERLKERQQFTEPHHLVFSMNGYSSLHSHSWTKHWNELMKGIGIENHSKAKLSFYSLRHFGITARVQSGLSLIEIAEMCGTSVAMIERTYLKYRKEQARTAALKTYRTNVDGTITKIG